MAKDESELVPMNKEPGYGGTDADEESKKPDIDMVKGKVSEYLIEKLQDCGAGLAGG